jgi:hypothetical protein
MGWEFTVRCENCRYQSETLSSGYGGGALFTCGNCRCIVNATAVPYRFEVQPCPKCGGGLSYWDRVTDDEIKCPRCGCALKEKIHIHFSCGYADTTPPTLSVGQRVHGFLEPDGRVMLVGHGLVRARLNGAVDLPFGTPIECEIMGKQDKTALLRFLNPVTPWRGPRKPDS